MRDIFKRYIYAPPNRNADTIWPAVAALVALYFSLHLYDTPTKSAVIMCAFGLVIRAISEFVPDKYVKVVPLLRIAFVIFFFIPAPWVFLVAVKGFISYFYPSNLNR